MIQRTKGQSLAEQYRPTNWAGVVGQDKACTMLQRLGARAGFGGRAFWVTGKSGTGKTTIARIIAGELADPHAIIELDAGELTPSELRDIEGQLSTYALSVGGERPGRALIVNEAHGLRADTMRSLLVMLERLPSSCVVVMTTTNDGQDALIEGKHDAEPLLSRCVRVALTSQGLRAPFAERAKAVAEAEGLGGASDAAWDRLAKDCKGNLRAMLQRVDAGEMMGGE